MSSIKYILGLLFTICKWGLNIFAKNNTPEMQEAKKRQEDEALKKKINNSIEKADTKEVQNALSE